LERTKIAMYNNIAIVGIAETAPARRSTVPLKEAVVDCVLAALEDAGIDPAEVDGIVTDTGIMPSLVPQDYVGGQLGVELAYAASLSYGGAGIVAAPLLAEQAIRSGRAKVVVSYFGVDWGSDPNGPYAFHDRYPGKYLYEKPHGFNAQPIYFAHLARRYMHEYLLREEELAAVAITHRQHAMLKGNAQTSKPLEMESYFTSRMIADPLRAVDCCLISDGAGAFVMTSGERAHDCRKKPVYVKGVGFAAGATTGDAAFTQNPDYLSTPGAHRAAQAAYHQAGLGPGDVDFAEIYDCFTISCLMELEDVGLVPRGQAGALFASGQASLTGSLPVNTHGGLLAYSYRLGIEHVVEAVRQLRGEAGATQLAKAQIGLVSGYSIPDYGVLLLGGPETGGKTRDL
jgi:acetyl-CoA acetyltransferase